MTGEPDNLEATSGTDNAQSSETDTFTPDWNYYDPDDEQDTVDAQESEETDEEAGSADETAEAEEQTEAEEESEGDPEQDQQAAPEADMSAKVRLSDGTEVTVEELTKGHMRQADYTRKSQDVANRRREVEAEVTRIEGITQAFVDHMSSLIPAAPDLSLAHSDPQAYTRQKAQHEAAVAQVQKLIEIGSQPKQMKQEIDEGKQRGVITEENQKLAEMFPETANREGRQKFFGDVQSAANQLGFSDQELRSATDHRLFALAHWAAKGMASEKAKSKAREKVQSAPPAAPRKPGQGAKKAVGNRDAMRNLTRSGSIKDAMKVDFD